MRTRDLMALVVTTALFTGAPLNAQEEDVRRDFMAWITAWSAQDAAGFCPYWMQDYHGFFADGGLMNSYSECDPTSTQATYDAGFDPSVTVRHLTVRTHGDFAAVACYFVGTIAMNPETLLTGPFRFTASMVKDGDRWKAIQYHFSPLDPMM